MTVESTEATENLQPLLVEATVGDYEILGELGRGGMAAVFLARDVSLNRKVAIKTMLPQFLGGPTMVARFKREAQMAAGLSHPHIVQIHAVKHTPKLLYFVMKHIEGRGLESVIESNGALDLDMARLILQQAGSALSFAHHRGVVHRDVKPANIMIDENGWAVVTDFGIAKVDDGSNLTATGTSVGTPHYMAPEQFHAQPLTAAADQYALGIVAYEMLSGKKPFDGPTLADIIRQHLFTDAPDIRAARPDLPDQVCSAINRMLAKEPGQRFPDLDAAIAAIGAPEPTKVDDARARLISFARSAPAKAPRLSVPLSPMPASRPSIPTTVVPQTLAEKHPQAAQATVASLPAMPRKKRSALPWIVALVVILAGGAIGARQYWTRSASPHIYAAQKLRQRGDLAGAQQQAVRAVQLEPNNPLALREAAIVFLARGDNERAQRLFVRSLRLNPRDQTAMGWLACASQRLGDTDAARRWAARAGGGPWAACIR